MDESSTASIFHPFALTDTEVPAMVSEVSTYISSIQVRSPNVKDESNGAVDNRVNDPDSSLAESAKTGYLLTTRYQSSAIETAPNDSPELAPRGVEQVLADAYRKLADQFSVPDELAEKLPVADYGERLTAEKAAANIVGFIERRLMLDVADGATTDELASRLQAGLSGFEQGFDEAREKLDALALLSPQIEADIGDTYNRVVAGIDQLRDKYLASETLPAPASSQDDSVSDSGAIAAASYDYAAENTFSFELMTQDGDKVKIFANASEGFSSNFVVNGSGGSSDITSYTSSGQFELRIEGELDDGELAAINTLLGQVTDLAADFYAGDVDKAFDSAKELGYDDNEIARFAFQLTHIDVQRVNAYQDPEVDHRGEGSVPVSEQLLPVGDFARHLQDVLSTAGKFANSQALVEQLSDQVAQFRDNLAQGNTHSDDHRTAVGEAKRFPDFIARLTHALNDA